MSMSSVMALYSYDITWISENLTGQWTGNHPVQTCAPKVQGCPRTSSLGRRVCLPVCAHYIRVLLRSTLIIAHTCVCALYWGASPPNPPGAPFTSGLKPDVKGGCRGEGSFAAGSPRYFPEGNASGVLGGSWLDPPRLTLCTRARVYCTSQGFSQKPWPKA